MKVTASRAIAAILSGVWPVERPTPALSKAITGAISGQRVHDGRVPRVDIAREMLQQNQWRSR
jgi:hypothetical protein